jgi:hypothetical protein
MYLRSEGRYKNAHKVFSIEFFVGKKETSCGGTILLKQEVRRIACAAAGAAGTYSNSKELSKQSGSQSQEETRTSDNS